MGEPGPWEQLCAEKLTGIDLATILSGLDLCGLSGPPPHTPSPRDEEVEILDGVGLTGRLRSSAVLVALLQAKLLTLLDTSTFRRVGDVKPIHVDVRFVASTNQILLSEVKAGKFREDLYYRLQVVAINIPALRERGDDVFILAEHFMRHFSARYERTIAGFDPEVRAIFRRYPWPGNVRELENLIERIFILEDDPCIMVRHLPARILRDAAEEAPRAALPAGFDAATEAFQQGLIRDALAKSGGGLGQAADLLGISRHALRHQMIKLGMR